MQTLEDFGSSRLPTQINSQSQLPTNTSGTAIIKSFQSMQKTFQEFATRRDSPLSVQDFNKTVKTLINEPVKKLDTKIQTIADKADNDSKKQQLDRQRQHEETKKLLQMQRDAIQNMHNQVYKDLSSTLNSTHDFMTNPLGAAQDFFMKDIAAPFMSMITGQSKQAKDNAIKEFNNQKIEKEKAVKESEQRKNNIQETSEELSTDIQNTGDRLSYDMMTAIEVQTQNLISGFSDIMETFGSAFFDTLSAMLQMPNAASDSSNSMLSLPASKLEANDANGVATVVHGDTDSTENLAELIEDNNKIILHNTKSDEIEKKNREEDKTATEKDRKKADEDRNETNDSLKENAKSGKLKEGIVLGVLFLIQTLVLWIMGGGIKRLFDTLVQKITQPFKDAWNTIKEWVYTRFPSLRPHPNKPKLGNETVEESGARTENTIATMSKIAEAQPDSTLTNPAMVLSGDVEDLTNGIAATDPTFAKGFLTGKGSKEEAQKTLTKYEMGKLYESHPEMQTDILNSLNGTAKAKYYVKSTDSYDLDKFKKDLSQMTTVEKGGLLLSNFGAAGKSGEVYENASAKATVMTDQLYGALKGYKQKDVFNKNGTLTDKGKTIISNSVTNNVQVPDKSPVAITTTN